MDKAAERLRLARANRELKRQLDEKFGFEGVVGNSPKMHEVIAKLKSIAPTSATVLIQGETGTGKELVAKAIHNNSPRKNKPFVAMNCTALNENLLEDELFGHEPGAFTGADRLRKGRFEHANGGTLFLDEVGDMPLTLAGQAAARAGEPGGLPHRQQRADQGQRPPAVGDQPRPGGGRRGGHVPPGPVLPPEGRDGQAAAAARAPRGHPAAGRALHQGVQPAGTARTSRGIAEPVRKAMAAYDWPGNVRELRNLIESMVVQDQRRRARAWTTCKRATAPRVLQRRTAGAPAPATWSAGR